MIKRIYRARWVCWQSIKVKKNICRPIHFFSTDQNLNTPKKTQKFTQNIFLLYNTHNFKISTWDAFSIASIMLQACLVTDQSKICIKLSLFISQINDKIRNLVVLILEKWPTLEFRRITPLVPVQHPYRLSTTSKTFIFLIRTIFKYKKLILVKIWPTDKK